MPTQNNNNNDTTVATTTVVFNSSTERTSIVLISINIIVMKVTNEVDQCNDKNSHSNDPNFDLLKVCPHHRPVVICNNNIPNATAMVGVVRNHLHKENDGDQIEMLNS
jgi:hypothetical protein